MSLHLTFVWHKLQQGTQRKAVVVMLTEQQLAHFRTFGFVILKDLFTQEESGEAQRRIRQCV